MLKITLLQPYDTRHKCIKQKGAMVKEAIPWWGEAGTKGELNDKQHPT